MANGAFAADLRFAKPAGGRSNPANRPSAAIVREVFEETGLRVRPRRIAADMPGAYDQPRIGSHSHWPHARTGTGGSTMHDESGRSVAATKHAVVIAGGGPTGLMLAAELALARVDV